MAAGLYFDLVTIVKCRCDIVPSLRSFGERCEDVECRESPGRRLEFMSLELHSLPDLIEQLGLERDDLLFSTEDLRFPFLQLRRSVSLGIRERLAPFVIFGDTREVTLRDLDEVTEYIIESDF